MPLVVIGVLLLIAHVADFGPFGHWPWWAIGLPFAGAVVWWSFADNSGWTQRRVMNKMERKKAERRESGALGVTGDAGDLGPPSGRIGRSDAGQLPADPPAARPGPMVVSRAAPSPTGRHQSASNTAPPLALQAFLANLASTPRV
jgi:small Trp-rich protein